MWEQACAANSIGDATECPYRWQRDPFVGAVLRAYATEDRLIALRPRMPAVLARGLEELCIQVKRAESWSHEQRAERMKNERGNGSGDG